MFNPTDLESLATVATAAGLGAVLGLEREFAGKPAGIRTHLFVAAGSALMMILGQGIIDEFQVGETPSVLSADPIRVLQAIVVGISFLGAGTIVHNGGNTVEGLTTASTIYLTAGIGLATAVNRVSLAVMITIFAFIVLVVLGYAERRVERWSKKHQSS